MITHNNTHTLKHAGSEDPLFQLGWSSFFQQQLNDNTSTGVPARIIGVRKNAFLVSQGHGEIQASMAGRLFNAADMSFPAVGDWILLQDSVINCVLDRKNALIRQAAGGRNRKKNETCSNAQIIAANLDMVFIVCGLDRDFNPRRIERYLTLVNNCNIKPVVVLTKTDLQQNPNHFIEEVKSVALGVSVYPVSIHEKDTVAQLANLLSLGQTAALIGSSGAGKSTLINLLSGKEIRATSEVGLKVGKGKHTTTTRDLVVLPSGGMVIDNPGIREIGLFIDSNETKSAFPEIEHAGQLCRFKNCTHTHEPDCKVMEAVSCDKISLSRLQNYRKLKNELAFLSLRENKSASRVEKERRKDLSKKIKSLKKKR